MNDTAPHKYITDNYLKMNRNKSIPWRKARTYLPHRWIIVFLSFLAPGCSRQYYLAESESLTRRENTVFVDAEKVSPVNRIFFNQKYSLDSLFREDDDEFSRILRLRNWISKAINISDFEGKYPGEGHADRILDLAAGGQGFHCEHYMIVQNAIMNSHGYVTRCLGVGPGVRGGPDVHHGTNEIWSNTYGKWFVSDAKYDHHFEKNGIPLSALEIRDEYLKNRGADILMIKGPGRQAAQSIRLLNRQGERYDRPAESFVQSYTWLSWERSNNRYTGWPSNRNDISHGNYYSDTFSIRNTWIREGKKHWAYDTPYMHLVDSRTALEWTPNVISSAVTLNGAVAKVRLESETPGFLRYEMNRDGLGWKPAGDYMEIRVRGQETRLSFRSVNVFEVAGPEHEVVIRRKSGKNAALPAQKSHSASKQYP